MSFIKDNKKYEIILTCINLDNINIKNKILSNDAFDKFNCDINCSAELIVCNDIDKISLRKYEIHKETYDDYLEFINNYDMSKDKWIYNILDRLCEQHLIIYQDELFLIIPPIDWNGNISNFHLLAIPRDKSLRTIRSLTAKHIELLEYMEKITLEIIYNKYNLQKNKLKIFFHYQPSTYHLHIHFINIDFTSCNSSVEYSFRLDDVIFNLKLNSDYYKLVTLNKKID